MNGLRCRAFGLCVVAAWTVGVANAQQDIASLVAQLGGADSAACSRAYSELQRRRDPAMIPLIGRDIETFPVTGQRYAYYLLRSRPIEETRAVLRRLLNARHAFLRVGAAFTLGRHREPRASAQLVDALGATPEAERQSVLGLVYIVDDPQVFDALVAWLHPGASAQLVCGVFRQLKRYEKGRTAALRSAAERLADSNDDGVRVGALAYLAGFDGEAAGKLAELFDDKPPLFWTVDELLDTDRKLPAKLVASMVAAATKPRSRHDVTRAASLLRRQSASAAVGALRELLGHEKDDYRSAALEALAAIPGGLADKDLRAMLNGDDIRSRIVAADTMRRRDDLTGLTVLLELLPEAGSHKADAAEALGAFRDRRVAPVLLDLLDDADLSVRRYAWRGLQGLMRGLFPYRRFDFAGSGYKPEAASRAAGIAMLRTWWESVSEQKR